MLGKVEKIVAIIDESCFCVSASVLSLLTVVAAFMRYVVGKPIMWTEEIQMVLVVWTVFSAVVLPSGNADTLQLTSCLKSFL